MPTGVLVDGTMHGTANGGGGFETRILIAEDNVPDARLLARLLKESGFPCQIEYADTLHKTIKRCERDCPGLILLDLGLGPAEGSEALEAVRSVCPSIAVVIVTGSDDDNLMVKTAQLGAHNYIRKDRLTVSRLLFAVYSALQFKEKAEREKDLAVYRERIRGLLREIEKSVERLETINKAEHNAAMGHEDKP